MLEGHLGFVTAAYILAVVTVCGLVIWVMSDHRRQVKKLADLETRGIVRRSRQNSEIT